MLLYLFYWCFITFSLLLIMKRVLSLALSRPWMRRIRPTMEKVSFSTTTASTSGYRPDVQQAERMTDTGTRRIFEEEHDMFRETARKWWQQQVCTNFWNRKWSFLGMITGLFLYHTIVYRLSPTMTNGKKLDWSLGKYGKALEAINFLGSLCRKVR